MPPKYFETEIGDKIYRKKLYTVFLRKYDLTIYQVL